MCQAPSVDLLWLGPPLGVRVDLRFICLLIIKLKGGRISDLALFGLMLSSAWDYLVFGTQPRSFHLKNSYYLLMKSILV